MIGLAQSSHLFTCDITGDFNISLQFQGKTERLIFDVITSWEVMEHISEPDLPKVASNVSKHLAPSGLWIMSVNPNEEVINGVRLHQTVRQKDWWIKKLAECGLFHLEQYVRYFNTQFVRGPKYNGPGSFHLIVSTDPSKAPAIPMEGTLRRLHDVWLGSIPQKVLSGTYV